MRQPRHIQQWQAEFHVPADILPDDRFIASTSEFNAWATDRKQLRMEFFYRDMRRKTGQLPRLAQTGARFQRPAGAV